MPQTQHCNSNSEKNTIDETWFTKLKQYLEHKYLHALADFARAPGYRTIQSASLTPCLYLCRKCDNFNPLSDAISGVRRIFERGGQKI